MVFSLLFRGKTVSSNVAGATVNNKPILCVINKTELVAAVAEETGKSKADVKEILEALIAQEVKTVKAGDEIGLIGFGTFKPAERAARTGRNPATGKEIKIPASGSRNL